MKLKTLLFLLLSCGFVLSLAGCAADQEMGLCTTLGWCDSECDEDSGDCGDTAPSPESSHTTHHGTYEDIAH